MERWNPIAKEYENVREGVKLIMGGKVLDYEAKPKSLFHYSGIQSDTRRSLDIWNKLLHKFFYSR